MAGAEIDLTPEGALALLAANARAERGTFVGELHEADRFDNDAFWRLFSAMTVISAEGSEKRSVESVRHAYTVQNYVLKRFIWHFSPNDGADLRGLPVGELQGYVERLEWVFDPVIMQRPGYGLSTEFDDDLVNPYGAQLKEVLTYRTR